MSGRGHAVAYTTTHSDELPTEKDTLCIYVKRGLMCHLRGCCNHKSVTLGDQVNVSSLSIHIPEKGRGTSTHLITSDQTCETPGASRQYILHNPGMIWRWNCNNERGNRLHRREGNWHMRGHPLLRHINFMIFPPPPSLSQVVTFLRPPT